jgi:hypothetical protein
MQTLENTREKDETMVTAGDEEVEADEEQDEFAGGLLTNVGREGHFGAMVVVVASTWLLTITHMAGVRSSQNASCIAYIEWLTLYDSSHLMHAPCRALLTRAPPQGPDHHLLQAHQGHVHLHLRAPGKHGLGGLSLTICS